MNLIRVIICAVLSISMFSVSSFATPQMISTSNLIEEIDRQQAEKEVADYVQTDDVKKLLAEHGVAPDEIESRLASLSDSEIQQLHGQLQEARAGGGILVAVLLVILIIYFAQRI